MKKKISWEVDLDMNDKDLLEVYKKVSQEEHNEYEAMYELLTYDIQIPYDKLKRALSYFILKTYLLENNLIGIATTK